jgi:hypothetical protein
MIYENMRGNTQTMRLTLCISYRKQRYIFELTSEGNGITMSKHENNLSYSPRVFLPKEGNSVLVKHQICKCTQAYLSSTHYNWVSVIPDEVKWYTSCPMQGEANL